MRPLLVVCLCIFIGSEAFETLFARSLAKLVHQAITPKREVEVPRPPSLRDSLISKLRNDLDGMRSSKLSDLNEKTSFDEGVGHVTETVRLTGVRNRGHNVSVFCGRLAENQLRGVHIRRRDAIIFTPEIAINGPVTKMELSVPRAWFRESRKASHRKEFKMFICYEGETKLLLLPLTVFQSDLTTTPEHYVYEQHHKFNEHMSIREVALVLDGKWNNAFLIPKHLNASILVHTRDATRRITYTDTCKAHRGVYQDCCLWEFTSRIAFGPEKQMKNVTFHRCVGQSPPDPLTLPIFENEQSSALAKGGMSRRFLFPPSRVCRESKFKPLKITVDASGDLYTKRLLHLDAVECAVYY